MTGPRGAAFSLRVAFPRARRTLLLPLAALLALASAWAAAQPVERSEVEGLRTRVTELTAEIEQLRGELRSQRGSIEQLERSLLQRFIELDRKIGAATGGEDSQTAAAVGDFQTRLQGAVTLIERGDLEKAEKELSTLLLEQPNASDAPLAWYWLGELQLNAGSLDGAEQAFGYLIAAYPDHWRVPASTYSLGEVFRRKGELDRARVQYHRVLERFPESPAARLAELSLDGLHADVLR